MPSWAPGSLLSLGARFAESRLLGLLALAKVLLPLTVRRFKQKAEDFPGYTGLADLDLYILSP